MSGFGGGRLLWDIAADHSRDNGGDVQSSEHSAVFIIGSKNSGKTSIILRFLDRDEVPKPTVALEYTFGRRAKGHNIAKDVGHIWELGGGTWLHKLMDVPINPDTIEHSALFLVVDLSVPAEIWFTMETLLAAAKARVEDVISQQRQEDPGLKDRLKKKAWERVGEEHTDKTMIDPFLIPLVIIGGKADLFQDFDSEKRKVICKTLRFIAHTHGASLQFFSSKQEQLVTKMRSLVSHHLFGTSAIECKYKFCESITEDGKISNVDHNKPLMVGAGADSLQEIGAPPLADKDIGRVHAKNPMHLWKQAFTGFFPQNDMLNPALVDDPAKDSQYAEHAIDSLRSQKDEELERYRRLCERRAKEALRGGQGETTY